MAGYFEAIDAEGAGTNVIHLIPHGGLRHEVLGNADRPATPEELERMEALVDRGMDAGAWGMSTGLIYIPSRYGDTDELIALSRVVAAHGGLYASHIRDESTGLLDSIAEAIRIGREAGLPVHVSHLKASGRDAWGLVVPACRAIAEARAAGLAVTADQYPYIASSTSLGAMVVPDWSLRDGDDAFAAIADDPERGRQLRDEIAEGLDRRNGGSTIRIARYADHPEWAGRDLASLAEQQGVPVVELVVTIQRHGGAGPSASRWTRTTSGTSCAEPFVATASDGSAHAPGGDDRPHPRSYGTFPRKIRYALDEQVLSLEAAVRSCSGLPAAILGLPDRGMIRPGAVADLVVFDPESFRDVATFDDPTRYATGVSYLYRRRRPRDRGRRVHGRDPRPRLAAQRGRPGRPDRHRRPDLDGRPATPLGRGPRRPWRGDRRRRHAGRRSSRSGGPPPRSSTAPTASRCPA